MLEALISQFAQIEDPRCDWRVEHKLIVRDSRLAGHRRRRPITVSKTALRETRVPKT
jgi:hypothetical protein